MIERNVLFTVYTEYQLILAVNDIFINKKFPIDIYQITIVIKLENMHKRMNKTYNLENLGLKVIYFEDDLLTSKKISTASKTIVDALLKKKWNHFIYFQENDTLNTMLSYSLAKKGVSLSLYQDGLKAYNPLKKRSYGQLIGEIKVRLWWINNGYKCDPILNSWNAYKYSFLKGTKLVNVTFPDAYNNYNNKIIEKINIKKSEELIKLISGVFSLDSFYLNEKNDVIFMISQSMRDDNTFEQLLINHLINKYPTKKIYIKSHPTQLKIYRDFIEKIKIQNSNEVTIIDDRVPAEFFLMQLSNSVVVSTISTSMFLENEDCRYYYTFDMAKPYIPRFNQYDTMNPTAHVKSVTSFEDII